jgi:hypothetical protein
MIKQLNIKGSTAYYQADALSDVNEEVIHNCFSQTNCGKLLFNLSGSDTDEYSTLKKNIPDSYAARIHYCATVEQFKRPSRPDGDSAVSVMNCGISFIRTLYVEKIMELYAEWKQYITPDRIDFSRNVAQYKLQADNSLCLAIKSVPVGLTTIYKREGTESYCLNWVWFDPALSARDRANAHHLTVGWLIEKGHTIDAFVDSFNIRSQRFFRKIGFRPACLHITKSSKQ